LGEVVGAVLPGGVRDHDGAVGLVGAPHHRPAPVVRGRPGPRRDPRLLRDGGRGPGHLSRVLGGLVRLGQGLPPALAGARARKHRERTAGRPGLPVALPRPGLYLPHRPGLRASLSGPPARLAPDAAADELLLPLLRVRGARLWGGPLRLPHPVGRQPRDLVAGGAGGDRHSGDRDPLARRSGLGRVGGHRGRLPALADVLGPHHLHLLRGGLRALDAPVPGLRARPGDRTARCRAGPAPGGRAVHGLAADADRAGLGVPLADLERAGDRCRAVALAEVVAVVDPVVLRVAAPCAPVLSRSGAAVCGYDCAMAMDSSALRELARDLGVGTDYWGWDGTRRDVDDDTLRAVLAGLGTPVSGDEDIAAVRARRERS